MAKGISYKLSKLADCQGFRGGDFLLTLGYENKDAGYKEKKARSVTLEPFSAIVAGGRTLHHRMRKSKNAWKNSSYRR
jgi:hypothetical protein